MKGVEPTRPSSEQVSRSIHYQDGFHDGAAFGQQCAEQRYIWIGIGIGCVLTTAIVLAVIYFTGVTK